MQSNYGQKAIKFIENNYNTLINKEKFISVSVGGSVAKGYAKEKSDIDLICISKFEKKYKKIFKEVNEFQVEIHIIPVQYIYALVENVKKYSDLNYTLPDSIDIFSMGAKKCNLIEKKQDNITKLLSDWREIKKITDSIILYETNSQFLTKFKNSIYKIKFSNEIIKNFENNMKEYLNIDKLINMLKLYSMCTNKVFSKVLWTDIYLENDYNKLVKQIILNNMKTEKENIEEYYKWLNNEYDNLIKYHSTISCDFCKNDYLQCNIIRCIRDYSNDAKKANMHKLKIGEILSIKKSIEYISLLFYKLQIHDEKLEQINNKITIDNDTITQLWEIIKGECIKYVSEQ